MMDYLIWIGAALAAIGIVGLVWCILKAIAAKRAGLQGEAMTAALRRVVVINMAALAVSGLGLMLVLVGVILS